MYFQKNVRSSDVSSSVSSSQTKQTQIPQMLLMTLIFQSSAIFVVPLCTFKQFNRLLVMNTVFEVWPHQQQEIQEAYHSTSPAGWSNQDAICLCVYTGWLIFNQLLSRKHPQVLFYQSTSPPFFLKPVLLHQNILKQINSLAKLGTTCELEGALDSLIQIIDKKVKKINKMALVMSSGGMPMVSGQQME